MKRAVEAALAVDRHAALSVEELPYATVLRTPRFPHSYDLNRAVLRSPEGLDSALQLDVLRITVPGDVPGPAGWKREVHLLMVFEGSPPPMPPDVTEIDPVDVRPARLVMWRGEDVPDPEEMLAMQEHIGSWPGAVSLGVREDGRPVAWAQVYNGVIDDVWVEPDCRGRGLGRKLTTGAMAAGGWFLWAGADDPRPQALYRSLGFEVAGRVTHFTASR